MTNLEDWHERLRITSRWIEVDGTPTVPVTGEVHFSRVPRDRWEETLRLLVSSGLTSVSTYVFWGHHEPVKGEVSFEGDLDVAAFLDVADRVGIDVILRIGPWCHGEVRNGGHPDWVVAEHGDRARTDDAGYLSSVAGWYARIAEQVARFCGPTGRIVGIQLENELYDQPDHIATLKRLARAAGMSAPLWTATGWGGALLPPHEVFPLYSGYADGFWAGQGSRWDDSFRDHFRFSHQWDDPGVGGDFREDGLEVVVREVDPEFPPSTCELGGGMATAYHRRPIARGADIAAIANVKIGNGSAWQGFYMYAGGINPRDHAQESHATGYPNDLPRFDYGFQAAFGATGRPGPSLAPLREHNAFLASFGPWLADTFSTLPADAPVAVHDLDTLRWAVRGDGRSGVVFVNTHQPHEPLHPVPDVQFRLALDDGEIIVPDRPIDVPTGVIARWPVRLEVADVRIEWATASLVAVAAGDLPTLVLRAHDGIIPRIALAAGATGVVDGTAVDLDVPIDLVPGSLLEVDGALRVLVMDEDAIERLWFVDGDLLSSDAPLWREGEDLVARSASAPSLERWTGLTFEPVALQTASSPGITAVAVEQRREGSPPRTRYGSFMGRSSAPDDAQIAEVAALFRLDLPGDAEELMAGDRVELEIEWEGDVAQLRADDELIADKFWDGLSWCVDITRIDPDAELTLHVAPISVESAVDLDATAAARVAAAGQLCAVRRVRRVVTARWTAAG
ncbi:beta-galactosidase [Pseudactinotalea suaedae]|uniref:beta-galactosidase n=1 Tax=Pseudactinotalea suaedae TaxID=1524924 RepID=UPI003F504D33